MKLSISALAAALLLAVAPAASADEATGKIKALDNAADTFVLADGTLFYLGEGASLKGLKPGVEVVVTYDVQSDLKVATSVKAKK
jgi:hypothetical protein